jgi:uncharacterized membrane protein
MDRIKKSEYERHYKLLQRLTDGVLYNLQFLILVGLELNDFIVATILFIQGVSLILGLFFLVMRMGTLLLSFRIRQFQAILRLTEEINRFQMISAIMHINSKTY